jgi:hypothetical protein
VTQKYKVDGKVDDKKMKMNMTWLSWLRTLESGRRDKMNATNL